MQEVGTEEKNNYELAAWWSRHAGLNALVLLLVLMFLSSLLSSCSLSFTLHDAVQLHINDYIVLERREKEKVKN